MLSFDENALWFFFFFLNHKYLIRVDFSHFSKIPHFSFASPFLPSFFESFPPPFPSSAKPRHNNKCSCRAKHSTRLIAFNVYPKGRALMRVSPAPSLSPQALFPILFPTSFRQLFSSNPGKSTAKLSKP